VRLVVGEGAALAAAGAAAGAAMSLASGHYLESQLYGVGATDPVVIGITTLALLALTAIATLIPARRAARIDPVRTLAAEE
jgi:putative ABC transport system permease protein